VKGTTFAPSTLGRRMRPSNLSIWAQPQHALLRRALTLIWGGSIGRCNPAAAASRPRPWSLSRHGMTTRLTVARSRNHECLKGDIYFRHREVTWLLSTAADRFRLHWEWPYSMVHLVTAPAISMLHCIWPAYGSFPCSLTAGLSNMLHTDVQAIDQ
jgi:hypothetical protein